MDKLPAGLALQCPLASMLLDLELLRAAPTFAFLSLSAQRLGWAVQHLLLPHTHCLLPAAICPQTGRC